MSGGAFAVEKRVGREEWNAWARDERVYAVVGTPLGQVELSRARSRDFSYMARAENWEVWRLSLDGRELLRLDDALQDPVCRERPVLGSLAGREFRLTADRPLTPSRREVRFALAHGAYRFICARGGRIALERDGKWLAERGREGWSVTFADEQVVALLSLFEASQLKRELGRPLLRSWRLAATAEVIGALVGGVVGSC